MGTQNLFWGHEVACGHVVGDPFSVSSKWLYVSVADLIHTAILLCGLCTHCMDVEKAHWNSYLLCYVFPLFLTYCYLLHSFHLCLSYLLVLRTALVLWCLLCYVLHYFADCHKLNFWARDSFLCYCLNVRGGCTRGAAIFCIIKIT
jgi:hypothetical protein